MDANLRLWVCWAAIGMSFVVYGVLPFLAPPFGAGQQILAPLVVALAGIALGIAAATIVVRRVAIVRPIESGALDPADPEGAQRLFMVSVVVWVLTESIAMFGLVLYFLYGNLVILYAFLLVAVVLILFHSPRLPARKASASDLARPEVKIG